MGYRAGELVGQLEQIAVCIQFGRGFRVSDELGIGTGEPCLADAR